MGTTVFMEKDKVDVGLFRNADYDLAELTLAISQCDSFVVAPEGEATAQCLVFNKKYFCDITHFAYTNKEDALALLIHVIDYYKGEEHKLRFLEAGCGNASLEKFILYQRAGFRVSGVQANYYVEGGKKVVVENAIPNLDMVRFRFNLQEKGFTTIGYNASGVK